MSQQERKRAAVNLQALFRSRDGVVLRGRARRIGKSDICFTSHDHPVLKRPGQIWILLTPESADQTPTVIEADCDALEVVHAANAIRVEFKVLRWGDNGEQLFKRIGLGG